MNLQEMEGNRRAPSGINILFVGIHADFTWTSSMDNSSVKALTKATSNSKYSSSTHCQSWVSQNTVQRGLGLHCIVATQVLNIFIAKYTYIDLLNDLWRCRLQLQEGGRGRGRARGRQELAAALRNGHCFVVVYEISWKGNWNHL